MTSDTNTTRTTPARVPHGTPQDAVCERVPTPGHHTAPSGMPCATPCALADLRVVDLGLIDYPAALAIQNETHAAVLAGHVPPTVYLLEHRPVITLTRRAAAAHLLADRAALEADGIALADTDRGGLVTYHGPGQLVVYPIVPLAPLGLNVRRYVRALEQTVIDTLAAFDVQARRDPAGIGVWVDEEFRISDFGLRIDKTPSHPGESAALSNPQSEIRNPQSSKIAAIGVRVRRWVTLHGLALNVTTNLAHYRHIVPCGLARPVTSLARLLGDSCPPMQAVKHAAITALGRHFG